MESRNHPFNFDQPLSFDKFTGCLSNMEDDELESGRRRCSNLGADDLLDEKPCIDDVEILSELSTADGWPEGRNTRTSLCERESGTSSRFSGRYTGGRSTGGRNTNSSGRSTGGRCTPERASFKSIRGALSSRDSTLRATDRATEEARPTEEFSDVLPSDAVVAGVASLLKLAHSNRGQNVSDDDSLLSEFPHDLCASPPPLPKSTQTRTAPSRVLAYRRNLLFPTSGNSTAKTIQLAPVQTADALDTTESDESFAYLSEMSTDAGSEMNTPYGSEGHAYGSERTMDTTTLESILTPYGSERTMDTTTLDSILTAYGSECTMDTSVLTPYGSERSHIEA